jgi:hypothetical protein
MSDISLVFGTVFDNSGTILTDASYVIYTSDKVILNLRDYSGETLYYFEDTSGGMGYIDISISTHTVTVSGDPEVFYIDGSANPKITFASGEIYIFDQSDSTNVGNILIFGTVPDSSVNLIDYQTIVGTPGQPGAYTTFTASGETVYYMSYQNKYYGYNDPHIIKTTTNVLGETVFSIQKSNTTGFYNQPDISFNVGEYHEFDIFDSTMSDVSLVFGTEVDNSGTILTDASYVTYTSDKIVLDLRDYSGETLYYFEDTSGGMGYMVPSGSYIYQLVQSDFRNTSVLGDWGLSSTYVYNYTLTGNTDYTFANGTYYISQSDYDTGADYHKYLHRVVSSGNDGQPGYDWHTSSSYNTSTGYANGSISTTTNTSTTYTGSWIQMKLPYGLNIKQISIDKRHAHTIANPK